MRIKFPKGVCTVQRFVGLVLFSLIVLSFGCGDTAEETPAAPVKQESATEPAEGQAESGEPQAQVLPVPVFSKMVELIDQPAIKTYWMKKVELPFVQLLMAKDEKLTWKIDDKGRLDTVGTRSNGQSESTRSYIMLIDHQCNANQGSGFIKIKRGTVYKNGGRVSDNIEDMRASYYWNGESWQLSKVESTPFYEGSSDPKRNQWSLSPEPSEKEFFSELADTAAKSFQ